MARLTAWILAAGASLALVTSSQAAQLGFYAGGAFGTTERDLDVANFDRFLLESFLPSLGFQPTANTSSLDTKDSGYAGLIGYRISRHFAVEGLFADFGEFEYRATTDGIFDERSISTQTRLTGKTTGLAIHGLAILPLSHRWEIYARGGVQFTSPGLRADLDGIRIEFDTSSTTDFVVGAGIAMSMLEIYGLRLEYQRVLDAGDSGSPEADIDMLSLGFIVAF